MKKTLIAVAALAATTAFAQNVTISGTIDATYRMTNTEQGNGLSYDTSKLGKDGSGTTGFTLSGMEDLGGGLKAEFLIENNFDVSNTADTASIANGQMFVGLAGAFGSVKLGAPNTPSLTVQSARGAGFGTKDGGRGTGLFGTTLTRFDSSVVYTSPNFSGFSFGLGYVPENETAATATGATGTGSMSDVGFFYANGPLAAGVTVYSQDYGKTAGTSSGDKTDQTNFYAAYNFGFAKFTVGGHTRKVQAAGAATADKDSGFNVAADVPLSPALTLTANIQSQDDKTVDNNDADSVAVGLNYAMSKRTSTYVRYVNISVDNVGAASTDTKDSSTFLVGLRHNF